MERLGLISYRMEEIVTRPPQQDSILIVEGRDPMRSELFREETASDQRVLTVRR